MTDFSKRIATIILPLRDNAGRQLKLQHGALRLALVNSYGGYTQSLVTGSWRNEDGEIFTEDSLRYDVAMDTGPAAGQQLVKIAARACVDADQQCVMIVLASGVVHFVKQNGEMS